VLVLTSIAVFGCTTMASANEQGEFYSSKQPYVAPTSTAYSAAPSGYQSIYTESIDRHGSRGLSGYKYDALLKLMAKTAAEQNGFVSDAAKQTFTQNLDAIIAANVANGYGMLTGQGATELQGIGTRAYQRNQDLFRRADTAGDQIQYETSGEGRATESGENFEKGLDAASGGKLDDNATAFEKRPDLLYFHDVENPDGTQKEPGTAAYTVAKTYQDYIDQATATGGKLANVYAFINSQPESQTAADTVLSQIFTQKFIDSIGTGAGQNIWYNTADGTKNGAQNCAPGADPSTDADACGSKSKKIASKVDAATDLYELYITGADMTAENSNGAFNFDQYFQEDKVGTAAQWFAYLLDVGDFYEKGPGFAGHTDSYQNAQPLLNDFFSSVDDRMAGGKTAATFRFGHAETIAPFASLLQVPGTQQQAPDVANPTSMAQVFSYDNNPFRSEDVSPMAANLQWDVVARTGTDPDTGKTYTPLVRMLYNEREIPFNSSCTPVSNGSTWYKETELKRCLNHTATTESPRISTVENPTSPSPTAAAPASATASASASVQAASGPLPRTGLDGWEVGTALAIVILGGAGLAVRATLRRHS
jgi:hypothetical protein